MIPPSIAFAFRYDHVTEGDLYPGAKIENPPCIAAIQPPFYGISPVEFLECEEGQQSTVGTDLGEPRLSEGHPSFIQDSS
jgi:hypothetical protein